MRFSLFCVLYIGLFAACNNPTNAPNHSQNAHEMTSPAKVGASESSWTISGDKLMLVWHEKVSDKETALKFATLTNSEKGIWSDVQTITQGENWFVNRVEFPKMSALPNGTFLTYHYEKQSSDEHTYAPIFTTSTDQGKTWSKAFKMPSSLQNHHKFINTLPLPEGSFFTTWLDERNYLKAMDELAKNPNLPVGEHGMPDANMELRAGILKPDGTLQSEMLLDERTCDCCALASTATKNALIVAYRDRSADEIREISVVRYEAGKWSAPMQISKDVWKIKGCPVNGPALASEGKDVFLTWYNLKNGKPTIQFSRSSDEGKTWSQALPIHDKTPIGQVNMVRMPDGTALVSWLENGDKGSELVVRKIHPDGNMEAVQRVANTGEGRGSIPQIALFQDAIYVTWTSTDAKKQKRVHVQRISI